MNYDHNEYVTTSNSTILIEILHFTHKKVIFFASKFAKRFKQRILNDLRSENFEEKISVVGMCFMWCYSTVALDWINVCDHCVVVIVVDADFFVWLNSMLQLWNLVCEWWVSCDMWQMKVWIDDFTSCIFVWSHKMDGFSLRIRFGCNWNHI